MITDAFTIYLWHTRTFRAAMLPQREYGEAFTAPQELVRREPHQSVYYNMEVLLPIFESLEG